MPSSGAAPVVVANFSQFRLEPHVQKSLQKAWTLSGGRPVNASHLLKGALLVARTDSSKAFQQLALLLPLPSIPDVKGTDIPPADLSALPLTKPLADSVHVAESFLKEKGGVWGRDYVTLALLAKDDSSLNDLAREASSSVQAIQDSWFYFLSSTQEHRTVESWQRWWRSAGVPLPEQTAPSGAPSNLLVWDPRAYPFPEIEEYAETIEKQGFCDFSWSTGNALVISPGGKVFLVKREDEPSGLVAVGEVQAAVTEAPQWDPVKQASGQTSPLAPVRWKALSREPFLVRARLENELGNLSSWLREPAGTLLPIDVTQKLEELWPRAWAEYLHGRRAVPAVDSRNWIARLDA